MFPFHSVWVEGWFARGRSRNTQSKLELRGLDGRTPPPWRFDANTSHAAGERPSRVQRGWYPDAKIDTSHIVRRPRLRGRTTAFARNINQASPHTTDNHAGEDDFQILIQPELAMLIFLGRSKVRVATTSGARPAPGDAPGPRARRRTRTHRRPPPPPQPLQRPPQSPGPAQAARGWTAVSSGSTCGTSRRRCLRKIRGDPRGVKAGATEPSAQPAKP